ncbi:MAG: class I SAM-dependent methyltransferase [Bacteroidia bacterium]|jgi:predicted O-methyltransferase YrrM|nr:class I SAM-dependent methyltransferase [Bacteroidia bacterium]MBP7244230.1 class I SAM-dependent methyltransferase [Bacteroidia bacterium]
MKRNQNTPPVKHNITASYKTPVIDQLLGRTTLEWTCDDGHKEALKASLRFTDYEGNSPSVYSVLRLPYIFKTWMQSRRSPILEEPVPFIVMDAIRFLETIVRPGMKVVEAGGGNSSLWFLEKGTHVTTYEHSAEWAGFVQKTVRENPLRFHEKNFNIKVMQGPSALADMALIPDQSLDFVLVDCMNDFTRRNDCMEVLMSKVKKGGWMILDNSDNPVNWVGADLMKGKEMHKFSGFAPMGLFVCQTTFWKM